MFKILCISIFLLLVARMVIRQMDYVFKTVKEYGLKSNKSIGAIIVNIIQFCFYCFTVWFFYDH